MCRINNKANTTVIKRHSNHTTGIIIEITRMTAISGKIIYAVLVRRHRHGHFKIWKYETLGKAWEQYKAAIA